MGEYSVYCTGKITLPFRPTIAITSLAGYLFLLYYRNQPLQPQSIFLAACQCLPLMVQNGGCRRFTGTEAQKNGTESELRKNGSNWLTAFYPGNPLPPPPFPQDSPLQDYISGFTNTRKWDILAL